MTKIVASFHFCNICITRFKKALKFLILYSYFTPMEREILTTTRKALRINMNPDIFGTFAEIGGGQEVSRTFFRAGGASNTIAKSVSAYDKSYSDYFYNNNKSGRYVSEDRLVKMLKKEYEEIVTLLKDKRPEGTCFFAFANTVATINYSKDIEGQGWIGMRFQLHPSSEPNEVVMHVNFLENESTLQQNTLGIIGVNLVFACFHYHERPNLFIQSLLDELSTDRININMLRMSGPDMNYVDNRLLGVQLVKNRMCTATLFDRYGKICQPADYLYKKNVLAFRGSFRPITYVGFDMLKTSYSIFKKDADYEKENTIALCEITLNNLLQEGSFDERDFLDRVDILNGMGQNVMVSHIREYYKLVKYFSQFKIKNLRIVIGALTFLKVLEKRYYDDLPGGILEAFGKLFTKNMKMYVYPALHDRTGELLTSHDVLMQDDLKYLYNYLCANSRIIDIKNANKKYLHIYSHDVLKMIHESNPDWENYVPKYISSRIKEKNLFGYKQEKATHP